MSNSDQSAVSKVFSEAIELAIEQRSPYPEGSIFIDADSPGLRQQIERAALEARTVVAVAADGSAEVLTPTK